MSKFLYSRFHHKPNNALAIAIVAVIGIIAAVGLFWLYSYFTETPRDTVVNKYIKAGETQNVGQMYSLLAPEYDGKNIDKDMKDFNGVTFAFNIGYTSSDQNGLEVVAHLRGLKGLSPFKKDVTLIGMESAWYLVNGNIRSDYK